MWVNGKTQTHADSVKVAGRGEDDHMGWKCVWKFALVLKLFDSTSSDQMKKKQNKKVCGLLRKF